MICSGRNLKHLLNTLNCAYLIGKTSKTNLKKNRHFLLTNTQFTWEQLHMASLYLVCDKSTWEINSGQIPAHFGQQAKMFLDFKNETPKKKKRKKCCLNVRTSIATSRQYTCMLSSNDQWEKKLNGEGECCEERKNGKAKLMCYWTKTIQSTGSLKTTTAFLKVTKAACRHTIASLNEMPAPPPPNILIWMNCASKSFIPKLSLILLFCCL